jgi:hypothetical protein
MMRQKTVLILALLALVGTVTTAGASMSLTPAYAFDFNDQGEDLDDQGEDLDDQGEDEVCPLYRCLDL